MRIPIESLCEVNFDHSVLYGITLCFKEKASLKDMAILNDPNIRNNITQLQIVGKQDPAVMEVLFSLLTNSSVRSLYIRRSNPLRWMEHIKKIGPCLSELAINSCSIKLTILTTISKYCPYLEKLSFNLYIADSSILQSIASNCPHLRSLAFWLHYSANTAADADLTAFAEKCPQLEELSLTCEQLTDQSVIALAQHCSRLKKLELNQFKLTAASLIALSERGLPLEELDITKIPIRSAEIAAQCAHALSRIRELYTNRYYHHMDSLLFMIQYMTGLRELELNSSEDHLLVPHLLLLLQGQCRAGLENLTIRPQSSITPQQLSELVTVFPKLQTVTIYKPICSSDAVLVELARSCPHLQKVTLDSNSEVTEEGVLALAVHCRQLREIHIPYTIVNEETVEEVMMRHSHQYTSKEIRALREAKIET